MQSAWSRLSFCLWIFWNSCKCISDPADAAFMRRWPWVAALKAKPDFCLSNTAAVRHMVQEKNSKNKGWECPYNNKAVFSPTLIFRQTAKLHKKNKIKKRMHTCATNYPFFKEGVFLTCFTLDGPQQWAVHHRTQSSLHFPAEMETLVYPSASPALF